MKQMKIWGLLFALILATHTLHAETKRYEIKSGMIEYTISGGGNMMGIQTKIEGYRKVLFKAWGNKALHEETIKSVVMGREEQTRQTTKIEDGNVYVVDYEQKAVMRYEPAMLMKSQYKDLAKSTKEMLLANGGSKTGEETILDYDCDIWETAQMKLWLHKGVMLKSQTNIMGITHTTIATNIQLNAHVSDEDLQLPDFPIKPVQQDSPSQMPQMTPEQIQQMQEMMKNFTQIPKE